MLFRQSTLLYNYVVHFIYSILSCFNLLFHFRYTSRAGTRLDILYSNIKHAFFQPSKAEMVVIIHFHLKHPLLIGKKKNSDVQVFAEVGEGMSDLHRSHYMHDKDDEVAEQIEREERLKMDALFNNFRYSPALFNSLEYCFVI